MISNDLRNAAAACRLMADMPAADLRTGMLATADLLDKAARAVEADAKAHSRRAQVQRPLLSWFRRFAVRPV